MKKLIAINLSMEEALAALVEYGIKTGKITYRGPAEMSVVVFQEAGKMQQVRVELQYDSEPDWQEKEQET